MKENNKNKCPYCKHKYTKKKYFLAHLQFYKINNYCRNKKTANKDYEKGEKHFGWKGGLRHTHSKIYKRVASILKQKCVLCGTTKLLGIHHIDNNYKNNNLNNLQIMCRGCHCKLHRSWECKNYVLTKEEFKIIRLLYSVGEYKLYTRKSNEKKYQSKYYFKRKYNQKNLAKMFDVSIPTIQRIIQKKGYEKYSGMI